MIAEMKPLVNELLKEADFPNLPPLKREELLLGAGEMGHLRVAGVVQLFGLNLQAAHPEFFRGGRLVRKLVEPWCRARESENPDRRFMVRAEQVFWAHNLARITVGDPDAIEQNSLVTLGDVKEYVTRIKKVEKARKLTQDLSPEAADLAVREAEVRAAEATAVRVRKAKGARLVSALKSFFFEGNPGILTRKQQEEIAPLLDRLSLEALNKEPVNSSKKRDFTF